MKKNKWKSEDKLPPWGEWDKDQPPPKELVDFLVENGMLEGSEGICIAASTTPSAMDVQEGGGHYKDMKIQPLEYIHANNIPFAEGCVIKYISRWRGKGGIQDLKKARHFLDMLIELEHKDA